MFGAVVVVIVLYLDLQLPIQSVLITTKVVCLNPFNGEVYSFTMIKFVSDLLHVSGFSRVLWFPPPYNWNIVENGIKHHKPKSTLSLHRFNTLIKSVKTFEEGICFDPKDFKLIGFPILWLWVYMLKFYSRSVSCIQKLMSTFLLNFFFRYCWYYYYYYEGRRGCDRMVVGFTITYAISAYHH